MKRQGRLFRKYALFIMSLVCGVLLLSGAISIYASYQENKLALWNLQHEKALSAATRFEQFIGQIEQQLTFAAGDQLGEAGSHQRLIEFLRLMRQAPAVTDVALVDASGHEQLFISRLAMDVIGSGRDRSADAAVRQAKPGQTYYSSVYFRKETEPYMTIAVRTSKVTVIAEVNLKLIWDVVSRIKIGENGKAFVVDGNGYLIADPDIGLVLKKTDLSKLAHVHAALGASDEPPARLSTDLAGKAVLTAFAPIASTGWRVLVEQPVDEVYATLQAAIWRTGTLVLIGFALSALASLWFARRMARPIAILSDGAERIGQGNLEQRIEIKTGDELEALAEQFNRMSTRLQESYSGLERKVADRTAALTEAMTQLQHTLDELTHAQKQLIQSEKMAALGSLVAGVAHEINTPVGVGVTAASSFQHSAANLLSLYRQGRMMKADLEEFLDVSEQTSSMILKNLERASNLIQSFKQVAVDQSSQAKRVFNVGEYLDEILVSLTPTLKQTQVSYTIACPQAIIIESDPGALSQIVTNLVMNALIHAFDANQAGHLTIAVRPDGHNLVLEFIDNGKGIPPDIVGKIFDPFFTTRRGSGGSGLGLNIVYNLVTQTLKGSIDCRSVVGQGTTFDIRFPAEHGHD